MTLDEFKEYINGKSVAVVGNSLDSLTTEQGEEIDSADITVRFGKAAPPAAEHFDKVGSRTDVWVTGQLRMVGYKWLPYTTKILFNRSRFKAELGRPPDAVDLFSEQECRDLETEFGCEDGKRLSAGALASIFFDRVANNWSSITYYNFDCFTRHTMFYSHLSNANIPASSWHLPLLLPEYVPENWVPEMGNPAHDSAAEVKVHKQSMKRTGAVWRGKPLVNNPQYLETPYIQMTDGRNPPRWDT